MVSRGSFTPSVARATSSAYRRLPIRWRLAGGSAALTLVILCGFATIVGVLEPSGLWGDWRNAPHVEGETLEENWTRALRQGLGDAPAFDQGAADILERFGESHVNRREP